MIRFSERLKRKRESCSGRRERILPHAPVVDGEFSVDINCYMDCNFAFLCEYQVKVRSTDRVSTLWCRLVEALAIDDEEEELEVKFRYRKTWLDEDDFLANLNIKEHSQIIALVEPSASLGVEFYKKGNYQQALAHLCNGLPSAACGRAEYAAYYVDILLHNRASAPGNAAGWKLEAAKWLLVAARDKDNNAYEWLKSSFPEFARSFDETSDKSTLRDELVVLLQDANKCKTFAP